MTFEIHVHVWIRGSPSTAEGLLILAIALVVLWIVVWFQSSSPAN